MRVVLKAEVRGLGRAGDVKDVADGYAQNFLLPRGLAVEATSGVLRGVEQQKATAQAKKDRAHHDAEALARRIATMTLRFSLKAGKDGRTFGSVTSKEIAEQLSQQLDQPIEKTKVHLIEPLRSLGTHDVEIRLLTDVRAKVPVSIEPA